MTEDLYITVKLPFNVANEPAKLLLSTALLFRYAVLKLHNALLNSGERIFSLYTLKRKYRSLTQRILYNRRYADGAINLVYVTWSSASVLGINPADIEWNWWLLFQQTEKEFPCTNITLKADFTVDVTVVHFTGRTGRVKLKPTIPKGYRKLLEELFRQRQRYCGRVIIDGFGERKGRFWVHGEVHLSIPYDFYLRVMRRFDEPLGDNVAGIDVNVDRINLAILSRDGEVLDYKTFWFEDAARKNCPRQRAWSLIGEAIHACLKYAYYHGVDTIYVEEPKVLGYLRLLWDVKGERRGAYYNYRVVMFRSSIINRIIMKAPLYGLNVKTVSPRGTTNSWLHDELMHKHGVDRHMASAILIALRGLGKF